MNLCKTGELRAEETFADSAFREAEYVRRKLVGVTDSVQLFFRLEAKSSDAYKIGCVTNARRYHIYSVQLYFRSANKSSDTWSVSIMN